MSTVPKQRADHLVVEQGLAESGAKAQAVIMAGEIYAGERRIDKPGERLPADTVLTRTSARPRYVSRGGEKLDAALREFALDVTGWTALDVGASTGGFTDCLRQRGARHIVALDVGKHLIDATLRDDARVTVIESCNARYLTRDKLPAGRAYDLAVIDVSFISLALILPSLAALGIPRLLPLIKPQFEVGKGEVGKGGVVRDPRLHERVIGEARECLEMLGYAVTGPARSPLTGPKGNVEFFLLGARGESMLTKRSSQSE